MISVKDRLLPIKDMLIKILPKKTYHYWRPNLTAPFIVWAEFEESDSVTADGSKSEQRLHGNVDFYTKKEFDPIVDEIQTGFNSLHNISWLYSDIQFEPETGLIHHSWDFWVM